MTASAGRVPAEHPRRGVLTVLSRKRRPNGTIDIRVALRQESGVVIREVQLHPDQRVTVCKHGDDTK